MELAKTETLKLRYATERERWQAVQDRDSAADGCFVYAVSTTGIYCRPWCFARLARRGHVSFFDTCEASEAAGLRPCKRCTPDEAGLREGLGGAGTISDSIYEAGFNANSRFYETSKGMLGMSPTEFRSGGGGDDDSICDR